MRWPRRSGRTGRRKRRFKRKVERIRRLLGDLVAQDDGFDSLPEHLRPPADLPDTDTLRESLLGRNIPALSAAIIEERENDWR